jgi:hypothetical protein
LVNSDDFVFDNEMLAQIIFFKHRIGEISCPTSYFPEASSINFPAQREVRFWRALDISAILSATAATRKISDIQRTGTRTWRLLSATGDR